MGVRIKILWLRDSTREITLNFNKSIIDFHDTNNFNEINFNNKYDFLIITSSYIKEQIFEIQKIIQQIFFDVVIIIINDNNIMLEDTIKYDYKVEYNKSYNATKKKILGIIKAHKIYVFQNIYFNYKNKIIIKDSQEYILSKIGSRILYILLVNLNNFLSSNEIKKIIRIKDSALVKVEIFKLRSILGQEFIVSSYGKGYKICDKIEN